MNVIFLHETHSTAEGEAGWKSGWGWWWWGGGVI